jgi:tetratricopeptide (TPR) repeat protein
MSLGRWNYRWFCVFSVWQFFGILLIFACSRAHGQASNLPTSQPAISTPATPQHGDAHPSEQNPTLTGQPVHSNSGIIKDDLKPMASMIQGNQSGPARVRLHRYLEQHPSDAQALFLFALSYHREQKYGQARAYFEQSIAADPQFPTSHYFYAWAMYYLGELDISRKSFDEFLKFKPTEADAWFGLGVIDLDEDKLEAAERDLQKSIALAQAEKPRPDSRQMSKGHARLADVYERQDRVYEAKSELIKATQLYPDHYEAFYKLSRILTRLGESEAAEEAHQQFLAAKERVRPGSTETAATKPATRPSPTTAPASRPQP